MKASGSDGLQEFIHKFATKLFEAMLNFCDILALSCVHIIEMVGILVNSNLKRLYFAMIP